MSRGNDGLVPGGRHYLEHATVIDQVVPRPILCPEPDNGSESALYSPRPVAPVVDPHTVVDTDGSEISTHPGKLVGFVVANFIELRPSTTRHIFIFICDVAFHFEDLDLDVKLPPSHGDGH